MRVGYNYYNIKEQKEGVKSLHETGNPGCKKSLKQYDLANWTGPPTPAGMVFVC